MAPNNVGILHPGEMGISLAASAQNNGYDVYWASEGRGALTRERAAKFGLRDTVSLAELCDACDVIVSVCPPHAAEVVANQVLAHGYKGLYLDANAISPQRVTRMSDAMTDVGITFVDGGIIGGPAWKAGETWLYLSGSHAQTAAACFAVGPLETCVIGDAVGKASALKMCYAAYTKGSTALLCAVMAASEKLEVRGELVQQWARDGAGLAEQAPKRVQGATAKAWRFVGEMEEIAATFDEAGLPDGFHLAAADLYRRISHLKDAPTTPALNDVLAALLSSTDETRGV